MNTSTSKSGAQIEPFEGWTPNCKYGLQRIDETEAGRLVRLEDVAIWLAEKWPRDRVIQRMFGPLIAGEGVEAGCLYVLNARTFAVPLTDGDRPNRAADEFWQYLPFVESNTLPEFVARDVAEAWDDCWPGLADPSTDMDWYMQRIIQANRERNALAKLLPANEIPAANSVSFDAESKRLQMERLRKLAVPVLKAHELWGYGQVIVPAAAVLSLVPAPVATAVALPMPSAAPAKRIAQKDQHPEWTGQRLSELRNTLKGDAPTQQMVVETGLHEREIRRRESAWRESRSNPIAANAFTAVKSTGTGGRGVKR